MNKKLQSDFEKAFNELKHNLELLFPKKAFAHADETIDDFYKTIKSLKSKKLSEEYLAFQTISKQHLLDSIGYRDDELFKNTMNIIKCMTSNELDLD